MVRQVVDMVDAPSTRGTVPPGHQDLAAGLRKGPPPADNQPVAKALEALSSDPFDVVVSAAASPAPAWRSTPPAAATASRWSSATTSPRDLSRSSKLVHGGLRYLQNFDLGLVREALLERQLMVALAPHLVRPLQLVVPAFEGARPDRIVGVG